MKKLFGMATLLLAAHAALAGGGSPGSFEATPVRMSTQYFAVKAVNDQGQIAGNNNSAALKVLAGTVQSPLVTSIAGIANAIDPLSDLRAGATVETDKTGSRVFKPAYFPTKNDAVPIPLATAYTSGQARDVNQTYVVGEMVKAGIPTGFVYNTTNKVNLLFWPSLPGNFSYVWAVNGKGQALLRECSPHAWDLAQTTILSVKYDGNTTRNKLSSPLFTYLGGNDISADGSVAGTGIVKGTGRKQAFVYRASTGKLEALSVPAGADSEAFGITDQGYVGGNLLKQGNPTAAIWDPQGNLISLQDIPGLSFAKNEVLTQIIGCSPGGNFVAKNQWDLPYVISMKKSGGPRFTGLNGADMLWLIPLSFPDSTDDRIPLVPGDWVMVYLSFTNEGDAPAEHTRVTLALQNASGTQQTLGATITADDMPDIFTAGQMSGSQPVSVSFLPYASVSAMVWQTSFWRWTAVNDVIPEVSPQKATFDLGTINPWENREISILFQISAPEGRG